MCRDAEKYKVDVCCMQECNIKQAIHTEKNGYRLIILKTDSKLYGNSFLSPHLSRTVYGRRGESVMIAPVFYKFDPKGNVLFKER